MKKLLNVITMVLALNFLAVAGGAGYLAYTKQLDREKVHAIKDVLFPKPPESAPATQPAVSTTQPSSTAKLDELLARYGGRVGAEQSQFIQHTFDAQMAQLDRRQRELTALKDSIDNAASKLAQDRSKLDADRQALAARQAEANRLASDKGFQDSLALYSSMPSKQVKAVFMTLDDQTIVNYLQAMEPRQAARITKEFKLPEEAERIARIMELMRQSHPQDAQQATAAQQAAASQ